MSRKLVARSAIMSLALIVQGVCCATTYWGNKTFFSPRSQGLDNARELAGRSQAFELITRGDATWTLALAPTYVHSFNNENIVNYFFGRNCIPASGSRVAGGRGPCDIFTDYLALPANFYSHVGFDPVRTSFVFDVDFYWQMPYLCNRLFFKLHVPIEHAQCDLRLAESVCRTCEGVVQPAPAFQPAGYLGTERIDRFARRDVPDDVEDAFEGGDFKVGDIVGWYEYGRMWGREAHTRIADLCATLGVSVVKRENAHCGIGLCVVFPTSNRPTAEFLYEAIAGNGQHWELGTEFLGSWHFWQPEDGCWNAGLYWQGRITHIFKGCQYRSYDFKCNPGSRYTLLAQFREGSDGLFFEDGTAAPYQYGQLLYPAINLSTLRTSIYVSAQADISVMFALQKNGLELDLGYDVWVRGAEKIACRDRFPYDCRKYAFKGDGQLYGFTTTTTVPLSMSQHAATIHGGQGITNFVPGHQYRNANADDPVYAFGVGGEPILQLDAEDSAELGIAQQQVYTSRNPIFLTDADIDVCSALMPRSWTNKIFAHVGYTWKEDVCVVPYLGVGAEIEWGSGCNAVFDQGGVWIKGGLVY